MDAASQQQSEEMEIINTNCMFHHPGPYYLSLFPLLYDDLLLIMDAASQQQSEEMERKCSTVRIY